MKKNIGDLKFLPKIGDVVRVDVEKIGAIVANSTTIDINPCLEQPIQWDAYFISISQVFSYQTAFLMIIDEFYFIKNRC
jgi:hypothetical protein